MFKQRYRSPDRERKIEKQTLKEHLNSPHFICFYLILRPHVAIFNGHSWRYSRDKRCWRWNPGFLPTKQSLTPLHLIVVPLYIYFWQIGELFSLKGAHDLLLALCSGRTPSSDLGSICNVDRKEISVKSVEDHFLTPVISVWLLYIYFYLWKIKICINFPRLL